MSDNDDDRRALATFLARNTVGETSALPLIHTTRSYNIASIKDTNHIKPTRCDVFDDDLTYLFVGRPAYKRNDPGSQAEYWELPCCFIFSELPGADLKRVYPFDSGGFARGLYPDYIGLMPMTQFEVDSPTAPGKIISAFFGDASRYFSGNAKDKDVFEDEFQLGVLETEVRALRRLAQDGTPSNFDDRRFSIEVQIGDTIDFAASPPDAVVLPSIYLRDEKVRSRIIDDWKALPITYEVYSLSLSAYDGIIYGKVKDYLHSKGYI
jgi:hypothetical protein